MFSLAKQEEVIGKPSDYASGLSLIIPESIESAALPIGWCVTPDVVERLRAEKDAGSPHLLISVGTFSQDSHNSDKRLLQEKYRRLVPLDQGMEFVDLFFEGGTYIAASIVVGERSKLCEEYLSWKNSTHPYERTEYTTYQNQLIKPFWLNNWGEEWTNVFYRSRSYDVGASIVFFEVPSGVFAEKPWDYTWLTLLLKTPRDQCSLRVRRRIFAYTIQPILLCVVFVSYLVLVSVRCFFLVALWIFGFWDASRSHLFEFDWKGGDVQVFPYHCGKNMYWKALSVIGRPLASRLPISQKLESIYSAWRRRRNDEKLGKAKALREVERARREKLFDSACDILHAKLTCAVDPHSEVVIHPGKETLVLKFRSLKARVCRPFSQER